MLDNENPELIRTRNRLENLSPGERMEAYPLLREFLRWVRRKHDEILGGDSLAEFDERMEAEDSEIDEMVRAGKSTLSGAMKERAHQIWGEAKAEAEHAASGMSSQFTDGRRLKNFLKARASADPLLRSSESGDSDIEASVLKGTIEQGIATELQKCLRTGH